MLLVRLSVAALLDDSATLHFSPKAALALGNNSCSHKHVSTTLNALCMLCSQEFLQFHSRPAACVLPLWQWRHSWCGNVSSDHLPGDVAGAQKVWDTHMDNLLPISIAPVSSWRRLILLVSHCTAGIFRQQPIGTIKACYPSSLQALQALSVPS